MPDTQTPPLRSARERIRQSRDTIHRSKYCLLRNKETDEYLVRRYRGLLQDAGAQIPAWIVRHRMLLERLHAELGISEELLETSNVLIETSRQRISGGGEASGAGVSAS